MKKFSAVVTDKMNGKRVFFENQEYNNRNEFIRDLRNNGYSVNPKKVKETPVFNYILRYTNCNSWDWDITITQFHDLIRLQGITIEELNRA